jgi:DNA-binding transcriptional LysR family regulator
VEATLRELESVKARITSRRSVVSGTVKICAAESLVALFIAPVIEAFGQHNPEVSFEIDTGSAPISPNSLLAGTLMSRWPFIPRSVRRFR